MRYNLYSLIFFLNSYVSGLLVPVLSLLLIEKGATLSSISILMGIYSFTVIVLELPTGILSDLIGRKKTFCLALYMSLTFSFVILLGRGFLILCVGTIINGITRAISSGSFEALFIDSYINEYGKEKLSVVTTRINVLDALGLSLGALTGGIFPRISSNYFLFTGTYDLNIIVKILLTVIILFLALKFINETKLKEKNEKISLKQHIKNSSNIVIKSKNIVCIFISVFSTGFFLSALEVYWQPHFISLMPDNSLMVLLGVMAFLYLAAAMLGNIIASKIIIKYNPNKMYVVIRIILAVSLVLMSIQTNIISFIVLYTLIYLIFGMANIPEGVILNMETPNEARASILSVNSLIMQIGMLFGSFINSIIINYTSIPKLWMIASGVIFIAILLIYKRLIKNGSNEELFSSE